MTNPEMFKQLFKEARETVTSWPNWMKTEEKESCSTENPAKQQCADSKKGERITA